MAENFMIIFVSRYIMVHLTAPNICPKHLGMHIVTHNGIEYFLNILSFLFFNIVFTPLYGH